MPDFRSDPSDSPEGKGIARRTWDAYVNSLRPVSEPVAEIVARKITEDLIGFWVMWHLCGGFDGLQRFGMHKATIWRKVAKFRAVMGKHPDEARFAGITIDPGSFWGSLSDAPSELSAGVTGTSGVWPSTERSGRSSRRRSSRVTAE